MTSITAIQERREQAIDNPYKPDPPNASTQTDAAAARTLQRTYRGHRARRELKGLSLSPSVRWTEAIKEAKYRDLTTPRPATGSSSSNGPQTSSEDNRGEDVKTPSEAQQQWRRVGDIARRAGGDECSTEEGEEEEGLSVKEREEKRKERREKRMKTANIMDLAYFLEMVDLHHRYGSHLRKYHAEWKKRPTRENFFYWLDHGEGRGVSLPNCSRDKLDSMRVRYLGREERVNYAVEVDAEGKLCWKRNGLRVNTTEQWRDSIKGIVRVEDEAPSPSEGLDFYVSSSESSERSGGGDNKSDGGVTDAEERSKRQKKPAAASAAIKTGWKEIAHDAKTKVWDRRPFKRSPKEADGRKKEKKKKWIFVADTSYRLYIGIKQSGAFQHSSFLHGGRVSAAGLIKVKDGQLKYMQPRSGHYKPPASSFRAFVHSLRERGVDMSVLSVPKSYAVLMGLEGYGKGMGGVEKVKKALGLEKKKGGGDEQEGEGKGGEEGEKG
ncbi:MAG: hypothetical protein LQ344_004492 [Seirophora lacunosa]|nr:MAG: hypothetical protein LQ344_004492 [Seirophora lacunosa]